MSATIKVETMEQASKLVISNNYEERSLAEAYIEQKIECANVDQLSAIALQVNQVLKRIGVETDGPYKPLAPFHLNMGIVEPGSTLMGFLSKITQHKDVSSLLKNDIVDMILPHLASTSATLRSRANKILVVIGDKADKSEGALLDKICGGLQTMAVKERTVKGREGAAKVDQMLQVALERIAHKRDMGVLSRLFATGFISGDTAFMALMAAMYGSEGDGTVSRERVQEIYNTSRRRIVGTFQASQTFNGKACATLLPQVAPHVVGLKKVQGVFDNDSKKFSIRLIRQ